MTTQTTANENASASVSTKPLRPAFHNTIDAHLKIAQWLREYLSELFDMPLEQISESMTFQQYGFDSCTAVGLSGELGDWLGCTIDPAIAYEYSSIAALAGALATNAELWKSDQNSAAANDCHG